MTTPMLTDRQREALTLMAYGLTYDQIAIEMGISTRTAAKYSGDARERMEERLQRIIPNTNALIALAITLGEIEIDIDT